MVSYTTAYETDGRGESAISSNSRAVSTTERAKRLGRRHRRAEVLWQAFAYSAFDPHAAATPELAQFPDGHLVLGTEISQTGEPTIGSTATAGTAPLRRRHRPDTRSRRGTASPRSGDTRRGPSRPTRTRTLAAVFGARGSPRIDDVEAAGTLDPRAGLVLDQEVARPEGLGAVRAVAEGGAVGMHGWKIA